MAYIISKYPTLSALQNEITNVNNNITNTITNEITNGNNTITTEITNVNNPVNAINNDITNEVNSIQHDMNNLNPEVNKTISYHTNHTDFMYQQFNTNHNYDTRKHLQDKVITLHINGE